MLDKLPPDLLLRVITSHERGEYNPTVLRSGEPLRAAHSISQVCSTLRAFVLSVYLGDTIVAADFTHVSCDDFLGEGTMSALARAPRLVSFAASYPHCRRSTDGESGNAVIAPLLQHACLQRLKLRGMSGVSDAFLCEAELPSLELLDLSYVAAVSSGTMRALSQFKMLRGLSLLGCTNVDDNALAELWLPGHVGRHLTEINLAYCPIGDDALREALAVAHGLQRLVLASSGCNLWATGSYTPHGIKSIEELFPGVVQFQV